MLAEFPNAGPARDDLAPGLRSFAVYPYVLFYRPITGGIEVVRVLDGRRNITPDLF
ncbi:Toxin ParE3 [Caulobacter sp. NIBR1757]|nr:Toxin ParE3 [Caulobacter sp. NIBR1757]